MKTSDKILIVDLEATCWQGSIPEGQVNEIIEIGICLLDTVTGALSGNKGILVRPERSTISPFCKQLTTLTAELLDREGVPFAEACRQLQETYNARQYTWASYGAYDLKMMSSQCDSRGVAFPFSEDHINVKKLFTEKKGLRKPTGMNGALYLLDIPLEGTHHRGVDDARNIGKILHWCLQQ